MWKFSSWSSTGARKINELDSKAIDVVWNGMTLTDGVMSAMACTNAYCKNAQAVVVRGQ